MECVSEKQGDVTVVKVSGRLDMSTSGDLDQECSRLIADGETRLFFDFEGLQFISSAGLRVILATAKKVRADLIVMAAHRPEFRDYLLGPNAYRVVRHAECSVLVVRR